ncbi:MAG: ThiF family adenylyltransferase [Pseudohongiellaceae bacterium]
MNHSLVLIQSQHHQLRQHLIADDQCESVAIILCHRAEGDSGARLIASELILIPADACSNRSAVRVDWPVTEYLTPDKITEIDQGGVSIITIHSHPAGHDKFSKTDDDNDRKLFGSVCHWFDDGRPNGSAIMLPDGRIVARLVNAKGKFTPIGSVAVIGEDIRIWKPANKTTKTPEAGLRVAQAFGKNTLTLLRGLRVGVIGCSGTGSVMIELLARNCVGQLVLVDPDCVEHKNLNRIINAMRRDARWRKPKVKAIKKAVESMGTGTAVEAHQAGTYNKQVVEALIDCDVIFGCVDSAEGRYHLECIASACYLPYFDVGVHLGVDSNGTITDATAAAHYMHPENASLLERGGYTSEQVTAEGWYRTNPKHYEQQRQDGYLPLVGEDQPAVISINMQAACMAFNDFMARLHGFRLDPNDEFAIQRVQLVHGYCSNESAPSQNPNPLFSKYAGMGDASFLLRKLKDNGE